MRYLCIEIYKALHKYNSAYSKKISSNSRKSSKVIYRSLEIPRLKQAAFDATSLKVQEIATSELQKILKLLKYYLVMGLDLLQFIAMLYFL